jgi:hypothetical protein
MALRTGPSDLRCDTCGYGIASRALPDACPMCAGRAWSPRLRGISSSITVTAGASGVLITVGRAPGERELGVLSTAVASLAHETPEIVVDLTRVSEFPTAAARLMLRLAVMARTSGGHLRARCSAGMRSSEVVELDVAPGRALTEIDGPVGRAFRDVAAGARPH